jgi:hypothetical protein
MGKTITELRKKRDQYLNELEDLYVYEHVDEYFHLRENELGYQIACIEEQLEKLEKELYLENNKAKRVMAVILLAAIVSSFIYMLLI